MPTRTDAASIWLLARSVSHLLRALETFKAQGIEFVSFSEQMDTSTPAGKMVFTVLGAVAELERSLIVERVKDVLRNTKTKANALGARRRSWTRRGLLRFERRESGGSGSPLEWELGSELFIAWSWRVPKFGKRFFEPEPPLGWYYSTKAA
jgi:hypothetical protein